MSTVVKNLDELADELFRRAHHWTERAGEDGQPEASRHFYDGIAEGFRRAGVIVKSTTFTEDAQ